MTDPQADRENGTLTLPLESDRRHAMSELVLEIATAAAGELDLDRILQAALDRLGARDRVHRRVDRARRRR